MSDIIFKVKFNDGNKFWKTDSFWSLSKNLNNAKTDIYSNIDILISNLIYLLTENYKKKKDEKRRLKEYINIWNNLKIGIDYINYNNKSYGSFDFIRNGEYKYEIILKNDKVELIDISRKTKLNSLK